MEIANILEQPEYSFVKTNPHLGDNVILLTIGGSNAYGTAVETSDLDIRGVAMDTHRDLMLGRSFESIVDKNTDTTVYAFNKFINLLRKANPTCMEMLGNSREQYLIYTPVTEALIQNARIFISKRVVQSYSGYASAQLHKVNNNMSRVNKTMMHTIRLYLQGIRILKTGTITTSCDEWHALLMSIRRGDLCESNGLPGEKFDKLVFQLQKEFYSVAEFSKFPDKPDDIKIDDFCVALINSFNREQSLNNII